VIKQPYARVLEAGTQALKIPAVAGKTLFIFRQRSNKIKEIMTLSA
jgi:hypothetical protein